MSKMTARTYWAYMEIHNLGDMLSNAGVPYEIEGLYDGFHIGIPSLRFDECKISVIEHGGSYGSALDLLEMQYLEGCVQGFLKAETAFQIIRKIMEENHEIQENKAEN